MDTPNTQLADLLDGIARQLRHANADSGTLDNALELVHYISKSGYYERKLEEMRQAEAEQD